MIPAKRRIMETSPQTPLSSIRSVCGMQKSMGRFPRVLAVAVKLGSNGAVGDAAWHAG
jgi:hypothetical protein